MSMCWRYGCTQLPKYIYWHVNSDKRVHMRFLRFPFCGASCKLPLSHSPPWACLSRPVGISSLPFLQTFLWAPIARAMEFKKAPAPKRAPWSKLGTCWFCISSASSTVSDPVISTSPWCTRLTEEQKQEHGAVPQGRGCWPQRTEGGGQGWGVWDWFCSLTSRCLHVYDVAVKTVELWRWSITLTIAF